MEDKENNIKDRAKTGSATKSSDRAKTSSVKKSSDRAKTGSRAKTTNGGRKQGSAAGSRPRSATAQEKRTTSTGRPLEKSVSNTAARRRGEETRKKSGAATRKRQSKPVISGKMMIAGAVIVGVILAFVVSAIMRASMLKVRQIETEYDINDIFSIYNYIEPDSNDAVLELEGEGIQPDKLGEYEVKYTIRRGKLSKKKKAVIVVSDSVAPYIDGNSEIDVAVGSTINWSDYYDVTDADPDIQDKLTSSADVSTDEVKSFFVTLSVTDWAGNTSSKEVTVNVVDNIDTDADTEDE